MRNGVDMKQDIAHRLPHDLGPATPPPLIGARRNPRGSAKSSRCSVAAPCHERRVEDMCGVMKGAFRSLSVLKAPFMARLVS